MEKYFKLVLFSAVMITLLNPSFANADDCTRARYAAIMQCKQFALAASGTNDQLAIATAQKVVANRAAGPQFKREFALKGSENMIKAAQQCRDTIPVCAKVCGETEYCAIEIEKMAVQIDMIVQDYKNRAK